MKVVNKKEIASLWSGYGNICRLTFSDQTTLIKKQVTAPHIGAGQIDESHGRKMISYEVERYFYNNVSEHVENAHIAKLHDSGSDFLIMEDLSVRYPFQDISNASIDDEKLVLKWLANFHASLWLSEFPTVPPPLTSINETGLWEEGSYWYFRTRMDEFESMPRNDKWREIGIKVDARIRAIPYNLKTIIHGDAKSANITYSKSRSTNKYDEVAMYDFQYVGYSPGVRDVVYYLISSSSHIQQPGIETEYLQYYYNTLITALCNRDDDTLHSVIEEYTYDVMIDHFELCILDYYRFMKGWGMWGNHRYAASRCEEILKHRLDLL